MTTTHTAKVFVGIVLQEHPKVLRYFMTREQFVRYTEKWNEDIELMMENDEDMKNMSNFLDTQLREPEEIGSDRCLQGGRADQLEWASHPDNRESCPLPDGYQNRHLIGRLIVSNDDYCTHSPIKVKDFYNAVNWARAEVESKLNPMEREGFNVQVWVFVRSW